jgi:hypothetical protein
VSPRTQWLLNSARTGQFSGTLPWRLKGLNVGGGTTMNRTAETRFALRSGWSSSQLDLRHFSSLRQDWPKTVRRNSPAETAGQIRAGIGLKTHSPRTHCGYKTRRTAPFFRHKIQRLKSQNVGGGPSRNRTGVQGFAVLCVTTPPSGRKSLEAPLWRASPLGQARADDLHGPTGHSRFSAQASQPLVFRSTMVGARYSCRYERPFEVPHGRGTRSLELQVY